MPSVIIFVFEICRRLWNSPTFTTWASFGSRTAGLVLVLPLVLTRFPTEEIVLYYLISTLIGLKLLANLGFTSTFYRCIAFAVGGARKISDVGAGNTLCVGEGKPNLDLLKRVVATMRRIYKRLSLWLFLVYGIGGTFLVSRPIQAISDPIQGWLAWGIVVAGTVVLFRGEIYSAFLQGTNNIALLRRWEAIFAWGSIASMAIVLLAGGGILWVVAVHQFWTLVTVGRNLILSRSVFEGWWRRTEFPDAIDRVVFGDVWPAAWRSGLAVAMSRGIVLLSGALYAWIATPAEAAMLLLGLKLIDTLSVFSQAPFYSKLPKLASLRAQGHHEGLKVFAQRGMRLSYWTYLLGWISLGFLGPWAFELIGANAEFPPLPFWALLGLAFFFERYGAMHIQLYSTTNHIIWHKANAVAGAIYLGFIALAFPTMGVYALPAGILAGYLGFYCWYSAMHSYRLLTESFWHFEKSTFLPVMVLGLAFTFYALAI